MTANDVNQVELDYRLNGHDHAGAAPTSKTLADLLRERHRLGGVRASCERAVCGACTVLVDGTPLAACSTFAYDVDGCAVETVESLAADDGALSAVQQAFAECGGFQCGFCTSGMVMLTTALLRHNASPDRAEIREWISSNTCRCTGYEMILESVERAAELAAEAGA